MDDLQKLILNSIRAAQPFEKLAERIQNVPARKRTIAVKGLRGSALGGAVATLAQNQSGDAAQRPGIILVVTANNERSGEIYDDLTFYGTAPVFHYPKVQVLPYEEDEPLLEEQIKHLEFLHHLIQPSTTGASGAPVCVTSIEALFMRIAPLAILQKLVERIAWGEKLDTEEFVRRAVGLGFERVTTVEARGEFAVRGGIVDIFPLDTENPLRIDLFGDEIESIRWFDLHTQRSLRNEDAIEHFAILPAREAVLTERALEPDKDGTPLHALPTLLEVLPESALLVLDTPEMFPVLDERFRQLSARRYTETLKSGRQVPPPETLFATLEDIEAAAKRFVQIHHTLVVEAEGAHGVSFHSTSFELVKPSLEHYVTDIRERLADDFTVILVCDNEGQAERMDEMLKENVIGAVQWIGGKGRTPGYHLLQTDPGKGFRDVIITTGGLHTGFVLAEAQLYVVTDREIFGRYKRRHVYRKIYKGAPIVDAREIRKGDYVVHIEHGIGRFEGIRTQTVDNRITDFIELVYSGEDKLLVPVDKIAYVQKYSGGEQAAPTLDKLGSKKWVQRRKKSQEDIEKMAGQLIELYAKRAVARGCQYHEDSVWQREFEASFLYTETPDQLRAIADVKTDMADDKPMDRLVCGDVGYGKTEVAIRAAFKCIQEKKQVALLCPTTVLAQQHHSTFRERFADYPIKVEMLSRFRTPAEARDTLAGVKEGKVQMVVGTHMLLSKSVQFRDLGLVIVDEEQRFGVIHKERLKELRASVDFLTLTATPIPRTLYMALSGLRDMSIINTPPADRHPIKTRIINWEREQIEEAILRELNRGGQVFFVHNRVQNIHQIAEKIREIVPTARIAVGHGQMNGHELEQVMLDFVDRKYDILVSTTIIESGLDIPNVNTIIINRADAFGLAQLYQLRGRVGRETRRAYAYLIVPIGQAITEQALARLAAIEEFTELGMGFNIAMRDMEIRGTGNLLGKEQHGIMNAVGFDLYCRMLEEAVHKLKGTMADAEEREVEIQWKVTAYLPADYIPVESQRVMLYKRIAEARSVVELDEVATEIRDRYGEVQRSLPDPKAKDGVRMTEDLPEAVDNLFNVARMRVLSNRVRIRRIVAMPSGFKLYREYAVRDFGPTVSKLIRGGIPKVYADDPDALDFHYSDIKHRRMLPEAVAVLAAIDAAM